MTTDSQSKFPFEVLFVILITLVAICIVLAVVGPEMLPQIVRVTPTVQQPTYPPTRQYSPEIIPPLTETPDAGRLAMRTPTATPTLTFTPTLTPTATLKGPLPDLIVAGISDPVCSSDHLDTTTGANVQLTVLVRNIGRLSTRPFGSFDVDISLILGQTYYKLDEWAAKFNGVIGSSNLKVSSLNAHAEVLLKFEIDLRGNTEFGVQAIANTGAHPIPEADTSNNTLIEYFSIRCY